MPTEIKIILADKNADTLKAAAADLGLDPERFVLACILSAIGVWPMDFFLKVKEALTALRSAPREIRQQLINILSLGLEGKITGRDFTTCLEELIDVGDRDDCQWSDEA